jgi:hypothetical protein
MKKSKYGQGVVFWISILFLAAGIHSVAHASVRRLSEEICSRPFETICTARDRSGIPDGRTISPDLKRVEIQSLKQKIRSQALRKIVRPFSQGGCAIRPKPFDPNQLNRSDLTLTPQEEALLLQITEFGKSVQLLCYLSVLEKQVYAEVANRLTPGEMRSAFERVRNQFQHRLREQANLNPEVEKLRSQMGDLVSKVQWIQADRFEEWGMLQRNPRLMSGPNIASLAGDDFSLCGIDGLKRNAFLSSTGYIDSQFKLSVHTGMLALVVCPGQILEVAALLPGSESTENLDQILGHEIAHAIHATWNRPATVDQTPDGTRLTLNLVEGYRKFQGCLRDQLSQELAPVQYLNDPGLETILGGPLQSTDFRLRELSAEFWGNEILAHSVVERAPDAPGATQARARIVRNSLSRLCLGGDGKLAIRDSSSHPSGKFRIQWALRNPTLRKALGCAESSVSSYCDLGGLHSD